MASNPRSFEAGRGTPIDPNAMTAKPRVRMNSDGGYTVFGGGSTDWFGPGNPIAPVAPPDQAGRQWDYPVALNQNFTQRGPISVPYSQLRNFSRYYDLARLMIEKRKGQIAKLEWAIQPRLEKGKPDARCEAIASFLRRPDGQNFWQQWIKKVLEDMIVCDCATIYPRFSVGGDLLALDTPDGTTFKLLIDEWGRTPAPPWPAYQQIIKGVPATSYTSDELFFLPFNPTNDRLYGYGLIEQVIVTITMALNNQASQLQYFMEGSVPDLILSVPENWTPQQVKEFKIWWDSILQGNLGARRGTMFVYNGTNAINSKEAVIKTPLDEWMARIMCYCFGMSPAPFVSTMNRATAESAAEQAKEEGVGPTMDWVRSVMDFIVDRVFKAPDLCFRWQEEDETDPKTKAETNEIKFRNGALLLNEWRHQDGLDPYADGNEPMLVTASGAVLLKDVLNPPEPPPDPASGGSIATPALPGDRKPSDAGTEKAAGGAAAPLPFVKSRKRKQQPSAADVAALTKSVHEVLQKVAVQVAQQIGERYQLSKAIDPIADDILGEIDMGTYALLNDTFDAAIAGVVEDGFIDAVLEVGANLQQMVAFGLPNTRAQQFAQARAAALIGTDATGGELAEATRLLLRGTVAEALDQSWTVSELERVLKSDAYAFSEDRAEVIARTELKNAMSAGNLEGWRASGVTGKQWQVSNDDVCDICIDNQDAGVIGIDELFPSGDDAPTAHPNCNCAVFPVVADDNED